MRGPGEGEWRECLLGRVSRESMSVFREGGNRGR